MLHPAKAKFWKLIYETATSFIGPLLLMCLIDLGNPIES